MTIIATIAVAMMNDLSLNNCQLRVTSFGSVCTFSLIQFFVSNLTTDNMHFYFIAVELILFFTYDLNIG